MARQQVVTTARNGVRRLVEALPIESGNYPYVTARVRAKKALLLRRDDYVRLLQMGIPEIARLLGERQYKAEMAALGARYRGVDLIEMATRNNLAAVARQILGFSEGHLRTMVAGYLDRWDVWNVKTILRGRIQGASAEEVGEDLVPAGSFAEPFLQELIALESVEKVMARLEDTIYAEAYERVGGDLSAPGKAAAYEDELAFLYYSRLLDAIPPTTEPNRLFRHFVETEIDLLNLKTLLRLWDEDVRPERPVFLSGGRELAPETLDALLDLDLPDMDRRLSAYSFYDAVREGLQELERVGVARLLRTLEKRHLEEASRYSHIHPLSVLPVLDFIVSKEREVENLRIIARGKAAGLSTERIRELLVV